MNRVELSAGQWLTFASIESDPDSDLITVGLSLTSQDIDDGLTPQVWFKVNETVLRDLGAACIAVADEGGFWEVYR